MGHQKTCKYLCPARWLTLCARPPMPDGCLESSGGALQGIVVMMEAYASLKARRPLGATLAKAEYIIPARRCIVHGHKTCSLRLEIKNKDDRRTIF